MVQTQMEIFTLCKQLPNIFFFLASSQVVWASFQFKFECYNFQSAFEISHLSWASA